MLYALDSEAMRAVEERAVDETGVTLAALMARAGAAVAADAQALAPAGRIVVMCGKGNNGGDGWVAAGALAEAGREVAVLAFADPGSYASPAREAFDAALAAGVAWSAPASDGELIAALDGVALVIDALFGFGFRGPTHEPYARAIEILNDADVAVLAVDVPSGVEADTGGVPGDAVFADVTLTFSAPKVGLLLYPGAAHSGEVRIADIGVPRSLLDEAGGAEVWDAEDYLDVFPFDPPDAHKGTRGRVLVCAGSRGMTGSAALASSAALRTGAGYVTLACADSLVETFAAKLTPVVIVPLPESSPGVLAADAADGLLRLAAGYDAVVLGPGLTTCAGPSELVRRVVRELACPLVADADALNAIAAAGELAALFARRAPTLVTPHPGEAARLLSTDIPSVQRERIASARALTGERTACVLKGAHTVVAGEGRVVIETAGNPGMATLGAGDVLSGMAGALLAKGLTPLEAGALAVHLHALAGDEAASVLTESCVTAEDILGAIPTAVASLLGW